MAIKAGQLKERADYQAYILEMLREENGYQVRPSTAYDPGYGLDVELLFSFLQATQPDALARLEKLYGGKTRQTILNYINNEVNKKSRSLLDVLKHGVEFDNGVRKKICRKCLTATAIRCCWWRISIKPALTSRSSVPCMLTSACGESMLCRPFLA